MVFSRFQHLTCRRAALTCSDKVTLVESVLGGDPLAHSMGPPLKQGRNSESEAEERKSRVPFLSLSQLRFLVL